MANIIYNTGLVFLTLGIIMLTIYITTVSNNMYIIRDHIEIEKPKQEVEKEVEKDKKDIYDSRVSNTFIKMFNSPPILTQYQDFDPNEPINKKFSKPF